MPVHGVAPWRRPPSRPEAVAVRAATVRRSRGISATTRPRLNTSARWQMRSTSSKSDEIKRAARPLPQRELKQVVDVRFRPDVDAYRRLLEDQQSRMGFHPARDHDLLLIAAGQSGRGLFDIRRLDGKAPCGRIGVIQFFRPGDPFEHALPARRRIQVDVLPHSQIRRDALLGAAARHEADPQRHRFRGTLRGDRLAVEQHAARRGRGLAENRPPDRVMTGAAQADQAEDFALGDRERDRPHMLRLKSLNGKPRRSVGGAASRTRPSSSARRSSARGPRRSSPAWEPSPAGGRRAGR